MRGSGAVGESVLLRKVGSSNTCISRDRLVIKTGSGSSTVESQGSLQITLITLINRYPPSQ